MLPPLTEHPVAHRLGVRAGDDSPVDAEHSDRLIDVNGAELLEHSALGRIEKASVLCESVGNSTTAVL